jgi:dihydrofolate reductase
MGKILIAAVSENNVIGRDGTIPWRIPKDLEHFRKLTTGHSIIVGRKTAESLGPLYNRTNIAVTRDGKFSDTRFLICHSIEEALKRAAESGDTAYFIGGAEIYRQAMSLADRMELTIIHKCYNGDTFFPKINYNEWDETGRKDFPSQDSIPPFSFVSYVRI